jgi:hypothetical protein
MYVIKTPVMAPIPFCATTAGSAVGFSTLVRVNVQVWPAMSEMPEKELSSSVAIFVFPVYS